MSERGTPAASPTLAEDGPAEEIAGPRAPAGLAATFRSLRHRNYRLYFFGQLVSLIGSWMQTTALVWVAFELTHQNKWTGLVSAATLLPTFLFGAWGGALAERLPKRSLLFATQTLFLIQALVLAGLVLSGVVTPTQLFLVTLAGGLVQAVDLPARLAFVMEMVGRDDLMNAVALNSLLFNVARALGPAFAGALMVWIGPGLSFLANGVSFFAVLWALACMDVGLRATVKAGRHGESLRAGFAYLARRPALGVLILLGGVLSFTGWPFLALLPGLAHRTLSAAEPASLTAAAAEPLPLGQPTPPDLAPETGRSNFSVMLSATGFGALAAAVAVATFGSMGRHRRFIAGGVCVMSAGLLGLSQVHHPASAFGCCALVGFGLILFFATAQAVVQLSAGDHNRGRIMGIWAMVTCGGLPLGNLVTGDAADRWGEPFVLGLLGLASGGAAVAVLLLFWFERTLPAGERGV
jgi:MFS family permease